MGSQIVFPKNVHASEFAFSNVIKNKAGGAMVFVNYGNQRKFILQTPLLGVPFGLSEYTPDNGPVKYSIDGSFNGYIDDPKIKQFHEAIQSIDNMMIDKGVENSVAWFGKAMSREVVENLYRPLIKASKFPDKYAPTIKFKIRSRGEHLDVEAYTPDRDRFDLHTMTPGTKVKLLVELAPVWFVNKQFGLTFNIVQAEVHPLEKLTGWSFQEDDE